MQYQYASGDIPSIMVWDVDKEQLVNTIPSSSDCSVSAVVSFSIARCLLLAIMLAIAILG